MVELGLGSHIGSRDNLNFFGVLEGFARNASGSREGQKTKIFSRGRYILTIIWGNMFSL